MAKKFKKLDFHDIAQKTGGILTVTS